MTASKIVLNAASGAGGDTTDVDDVFSTFVYSGNSSTDRDIVNNIDLSGEGGMIWTKERTGGQDHTLFDTERGTNRINPNNDSAQFGDPDGVRAYNSNGYNLSNGGDVNATGDDYVSWTFRKAPKFFDVVTYTGNGVAGRTVSHNLGSAPGMMFVKKTNAADEWYVFHRSEGAGQTAYLNHTNAFGTASAVWNNTAPTSTVFTVGTINGTNQDGQSYVAYLFAHNNNDGGFGPDSDQDIIKCGTATTPSSAGDFEVNLGFEPQFLIYKLRSAGGWYIHDTMRSLHHDDSSQPTLFANQSYYETQITSNNHVEPIPTGFRITQNAVNQALGTNAPFIYMAIRRGPLAEPTDATKVFGIDGTSADGSGPTSGIVTDFSLLKRVSTADDWYTTARLIGQKYLLTNSNQQELSANNIAHDRMDGVWDELNQNDYDFWAWKRAPGYFDVVTYTGTGSAQTISHNLGVAPEMMWIKQRDTTQNWAVYHKGLNGGTDPEDYALELNSTSAEFNTATYFNDTAPTSTVFTVGNGGAVNTSSGTYLAMLFGTVAGVSKVGSINITSTSDFNVDCGFSNGAKFVMVKGFNASTGWYVSDSVRGINSGSADPVIFMNNNSAENTSVDWIEPLSSGFTIKGSVWNSYNVVFYAVAA